VSGPRLRTPGQTGPGAHLAHTGDEHGVRALLADLFPAPAEPATRRAGLARWAFPVVQVAAVALGTLVMLVRIGGPRPSWDRMYAEDPGLYLPAALAHPWHLLQAYGGYLQLVPRVIAQIAALVPIRHASVVFAVGGAVVASGCAVFAYHASAGHVSSRWLRALLGLSVLLLPVAQLEVADNGVNSIWYLLVALFWAALWRPRSRAGAGVAAVVAFFAAASSSLALVYAPLFGARVLAVPGRGRAHAATVGWALGSMLQISVIVTSHLSRFSLRDPLNAVVYYSRDVVLPALGWHDSWHLRDAIGPDGGSLLVGGLIAVVLVAAAATQGRRCQVFVITAVAGSLVLTGLTSFLAWGGPGQLDTVAVEHGARYSTVPILLLVSALIVSADSFARRWWPRPKAVVAVAVLVAVLGTGWITDFRYPVRRYAGPSSAWVTTVDAWLRYCQRTPTGTITVTFPDWWGTGRQASTFSCQSLRR
jgi:hypothetical protein